MTAFLGLSLLLLGGLGVTGAFLVVRRDPRAGAYLLLLSGAGCTSVTAVPGTGLGAVPGFLLLGAGALASVPRARQKEPGVAARQDGRRPFTARAPAAGATGHRAA